MVVEVTFTPIERNRNTKDLHVTGLFRLPFLLLERMKPTIMFLASNFGLVNKQFLGTVQQAIPGGILASNRLLNVDFPGKRN